MLAKIYRAFNIPTPRGTSGQSKALNRSINGINNLFDINSRFSRITKAFQSSINGINNLYDINSRITKGLQRTINGINHLYDINSRITQALQRSIKGINNLLDINSRITRVLRRSINVINNLLNNNPGAFSKSNVTLILDGNLDLLIFVIWRSVQPTQNFLREIHLDLLENLKI